MQTSRLIRPAFSYDWRIVARSIKVVIPVALALLFCEFFSISAPLSGTALDRETKLPVEGAVVVRARRVCTFSPVGAS